MKVTFTKTAERRYRVSVEGPGELFSWIEPAPGYNDLLPHDMAHFVVEDELGIAGGVFGQLAAGGHARTFHSNEKQRDRRAVRRGHRIAKANRKEAELSELLVQVAWQRWRNLPSNRSLKGVMAKDIERVCERFEEVSKIWSNLAVGEAMTLTWKVGSARKKPPRAQHKKS